MDTLLQELFKEREDKYPHFLKKNFARVLTKIMSLWGTPELDAYFHELMIDYTGDRQGFPREAIAEILTLSLMHDKIMGEKNKKNEDVWSNERIKCGLEEEHVEYSPRGFFQALDAGNARAVQLFIEAGVNLDDVNAAGWTPLMISSFMGSEQTAAMLIKAGANVNVRDNRGYGPLHWASYQGFTKITKLLLEKGAFVNSKSKSGLSPLLQASARGHVEIVKLLISKNAYVNDGDEEGWTPLHKAVANGHKEVVALLIAANADPYLPHNSGLTATMMAERKNNRGIAQLLPH